MMLSLERKRKIGTITTLYYHLHTSFHSLSLKFINSAKYCNCRLVCCLVGVRLHGSMFLLRDDLVNNYSRSGKQNEQMLQIIFSMVKI